MNLDNVADMVTAFADNEGDQPTALHISTFGWENLMTDARIVNVFDPNTLFADVIKDEATLNRLNLGRLYGMQVHAYFVGDPDMAYVD